jgi:4-hydroxybenzoate decarboxylase
VLDDGRELLHGRIGDLPQIVHFERDAGPYITSAVFLAREPETGIPNLSFHRAMMIGDRELRIRLGRSHHLTMYQAKAEAMGKPLEAAMLIGPPPEVFLAAAAPVAYDEDEIAVAAKLGRKPVAMRHCRTSDLTVPAETEIVIEGRILPHVRRREGPFGEFMGYYVPEDDNHVFEVLDVSWRPGAAYHSLLCGSPEDLNTLELAVATTIHQRVSAALPGILDVACHSHIIQTVVKIRQQYEGHARQVLIAALAANFDWSKICTVVDEDVDIHDLNDVMWAFATRGRADTAAFTVPAVPGFYRDPHKDYWGRLCLDATKPWGREAEFARKRIPGAAAVDLRNYVR